MSERNPRYKYEFRSQSKKVIRHRSKNRCALTGTRTNLNIHHQLPIWFAREKNLDRRLIRHQANGVLINAQDHKEIHREISSWEEEQQLIYYRALYAHILGVVRGNVSKTLQEVKPPLYEFEPQEVVIYEAVGD